MSRIVGSEAELWADGQLPPAYRTVVWIPRRKPGLLARLFGWLWS